jgi:hypothetical protein
MAPRMSDTSISANEIEKAGIPSLSASGLMGAGFDIQECDPISEKEFRMLMLFVGIAAFAFGCIVNGWLL